MWAGTQNGLARWDGQKWKLFTTSDGLSGNVVRAIAEATNGDLWIGTENQGLNCFKDGKFVSIQASEKGLPGNDISCLYADPDGVLWVGTAGHGLARFQDGKWTRYSTDNGLASDFICYLLEDDGGQFVARFQHGPDADSKKIAERFCRRKNQFDFLPDIHGDRRPANARMHRRFAARRDSRAKTENCGFPTTKGLVSVNPAELKPNLQPPIVLIESVKD